MFNHKVETEGKPVTNQKSSGRCWLFACLNVARQPFVKHYNLEDFEFSQAHLFYWDKIERANYFLQNISMTSYPCSVSSSFDYTLQCMHVDKSKYFSSDCQARGGCDQQDRVLHPERPHQ